MKIGQPKLSERETQKSGLLATPTSQGKQDMIRFDGYASKYIKKGSAISGPAFDL
jgi:hypothetical protein